MPSIINIAFYKFVPLQNLEERATGLHSFCCSQKIKGTIRLAEEGINGSLAGTKEAIDAFQMFIQKDPLLSPLSYKESISDYQPFEKMPVKIKKEIVTMRTAGIDPLQQSVPTISPIELKQWIEEKKDFVLLDTRNNYEYQLGTFEGALEIGVENFRDFPQKVSTLPTEWKQKNIVTFCTGGIRCEKAAPYLQSQGFEKVFQLDGGILNYFKECGGDKWQGDCFVFDNRIALDPKLNPTGATLCECCQAPLRKEQKQCPFCNRENLSA